MSARALDTGPDPRQVRVGLVVAGTSGTLISVQQRINGRLGTELGDPLTAALISFSMGLFLMTVVLALRPVSRRRLAAVRRTRPWERLGGAGGASLVAVGALAAPEIGVALLTVGLVAGQVGGGLLVDRVGLGPGGPRPVTGPRLTAGVLCLLAVVVSSLGRTVRDVDPALLLLVVGAGALVSVQQALNGRVKEATGDAPATVLVNFAVGTAALALGLAVHAALGGLSLSAPPTEPYLYLGGAVGVLFVAVAAIVVRLVGVLRLGLAVIAGQLVGAVLLDLVVPVAGASLSPLTLAGSLLALVPVLVVGRGSSVRPSVDARD